MEEKNLYQELAEKIMVSDSRIIPQLFKMLINEKEAEILLALPATPAEIAQRFSIIEPEADKLLDQFFIKGLAFKSKKQEGTKYRLCRDLVQFHDATILWSGAQRAYFDLWQRFMEEEWPEYSGLVEKIITRPLSRIIPVNQAVSASSQVLAYENCVEIINAANRIAVAKCTCRLIAHKCNSPLENCLQIGRAADYSLERGTGREISKAEALKLIDEAEKKGLIHVTMNKSDNMNLICNCCACCCIAMPVMIKYGRKLTDPSRFRAVIDDARCSSCGDCIERCFFSAISSQSTDGFEVVSIDEGKCMGCGLCQVVCDCEAISLIETRPTDFIPVM